MDQDETLLAYFHGRLSAPDTADFERKIAGDRGLQAELAALRAATDVMAKDQADPTLKARGWARLSDSIAAERFGASANSNRAPRFAQTAAVAAAAVIAWQFLAVPYLPLRDDALYSPVSEAVQDHALRIVFVQGVLLDDAAELLRQAEATVIDGPTAVGLFTVSFEDDIARTAGMQILQSRPDLVLTVARP